MLLKGGEVKVTNFKKTYDFRNEERAQNDHEGANGRERKKEKEGRT